MAIRWVFFDIGDVLFDEDAPHLYYYHTLLAAMRRRGIAVTWDEYHARIQACVREKPANPIIDAARHYVPDDALWDEIYHEGRGVYEAVRKPRPYGMLLDDITAVVQEMRKEFHVGIIANQHTQILQGLDDYGISSLFDVKVIDEVVGVSKPDPAIFHLALEQAGCTPNEAIMIGDRPDNDIVPAKAVGMPTIRFRRGILYALYDPRREEERADIVVREAPRLLPAVRRIAQSQTE